MENDEMNKGTEFDDNNAWLPWSKHVLLELQRLDKNDTDIEKKIDELRADMNKRFKELNDDYIVTKTDLRHFNQRNSTMYGVLGGAVVSVIVGLVIALIQHLIN